MTGTTAQDEREHLYRLLFTRDGLRLCGCGDSEGAYDLVREILALTPFYDNREKLEALCPPAALHIVLSCLDGAGLIEHGGAIGGSWLTPKGSHYLDLMQRHELDDSEDVGLPHGGEDCAAMKCRHWKAAEGSPS